MLSHNSELTSTFVVSLGVLSLAMEAITRKAYLAEGEEGGGRMERDFSFLRLTILKPDMPQMDEGEEKTFEESESEVQAEGIWDFREEKGRIGGLGGGWWGGVGGEEVEESEDVWEGESWIVLWFWYCWEWAWGAGRVWAGGAGGAAGVGVGIDALTVGGGENCCCCWA